MKITHLCLGAFFPDNYSYQENMLPKFHKQLGYDVDVIASLDTFDEHGKLSYYPKASKYTNENDVNVIRLDYRKPEKLYRKLKRFVGLENALNESRPDILFIHNVQFLDMNIVVQYIKKHKYLKVFCDNHADFSNSARKWFSKNILHGLIWKHCAHMIEPYTSKFYGVLPARVDFLKNIYNLPGDKCELLVMGADDDLVERASNENVKKEVRNKYDINVDDFLVITGGKIDGFKKQTLLLMDAVNSIDNAKLKLIVFGSVTPELQQEVEKRCTKRVIYIGWQKSVYSYDLFAAADLAVFPGRHSVFWEQVAAQGIPMICKSWDGTHHIDIGGNVIFLDKDDVEEIREKILMLIENPEKYNYMKCKAVEEGKRVFSYKDIAKRAIS